MRGGGVSYAVNLSNTRATPNNTISFSNPSYQPFWSAQFTQPLLRNFKTDANRQQLSITRINRDISDVQLKATITKAYVSVRELSKDKKVTFRTAAYGIALQRVADAERLRGN